MSGWDPLGAGWDTARVAVTEADERAQRSRDARANVAAILFEQCGIEPGAVMPRAPYVRAVGKVVIAPVLEALGLPVQPVAKPLPWSEPLPPRRGRPPKTTGPGQGRCQHCKRTYRIGPSGRLPVHPAWGVHEGAVTRLPWDCHGSRQEVVPRDCHDPRCASPMASVWSPDPVGEVA